MWREEYDDVLRRNYKVPGGLCSRELAERFGTSKGSVIRRARTLGLAVDTHVRAAIRRPRKPPAARPERQVPPLPLSLLVEQPGYIEPIQPLVNPPRPAKLKRPREEVRSSVPWSPFKTCQWIDGYGAGAERCGCQSKPGYSWCPDHHARVFYVPRKAGAE